MGCFVCAILYPLLARDWPADVGLAANGETRVQPPANASVGNVVSLTIAVLQEAMSTGWFWLLIGTFFVCGVSSTGIVQQHFIPFCADNGVAPILAASYLATMPVQLHRHDLPLPLPFVDLLQRPAHEL
jgi:hypothetical protein